jgi:hypothetical protein
MPHSMFCTVLIVWQPHCAAILLKSGTAAAARDTSFVTVYELPCVGLAG